MASINHPPETVVVEPTMVVNIPGQGSVRGVRNKDSDLVRFLNIPYATVTKRWRNASPVKAWRGIRDATHYGPMCPQQLVGKSTDVSKLFGMPAVNDGFHYSFSERDCLNLAIYVPDLTRASLPVGGIPVVVRIHGGRLRNGGNAHPVHDMSNFVLASVKAQKPVIAVAINYRLGCLGFFASNELAFEFDSDPDNILHNRTHDQDPAFGNWGLADQRLAFEWIRKNIGAFGGDASNVTALGYSAGGTAIMNHMMIPSHHGLFSRAIVHSGGSTVILARYAYFQCQKTFDLLYNYVRAVNTAIKSAQEDTPYRSVHEQELLQRAHTLRNASVETLMQAPQFKGNNSILYPNLDNKFLFPSPKSLIASDSPHFDPGVKSILFSSTANEGTLFTSSNGATSLQKWRSFLDRWVDPKLHQDVESLYGKPQTDADAITFSGDIVGDILVAYPTLSSCQGYLAQKDEHQVLYRQYIDRSLEAVDKWGQGLGVPHGTDMAFTTMSDLNQLYMTEREKAFGYRVMEKYLQFAYGLGFDGLDRIGHGEAEIKDGNGAVVWSKDFEFRTGDFERMNNRKIDLWRKNEEWAARQRPPQPLGSANARPKL
ncbi:hypothetical protein EMPS_09814 [Entomortierella parvispora]|uniref:Carboxylesterase type B domain-containing protein n=1 Tax=Entomortierella parvispora TaxID=205924 RepID=A0A9P3M0Y7_9FUNG|nr:hypothetical protein EMPS_09814 [Entomortierella parvispora]